MTSIALRNTERSAVIAALEAEYPTDRAAADALIRVVVDQLAWRDTVGIRVPVGPTLALAFGPWWHQGAALAVARQLPGAELHRLYSPARFVELLDPRTHEVPKHCELCSHPNFAHGFGGRGCAVRKCKCKKTVK